MSRNSRYFPPSQQVRTGEWKEDAPCQNMPGDWISMPEGYNRRNYRKFKGYELAVCDTCPVKTYCLEHALVFGETLGIWGGTLPHERENKPNG